MISNPYSNIKIFKHMNKLNNMEKGIVTSPISIRIKPTNKCNFNCYYCSYINAKDSMRDVVDASFNYNLNDHISENVMDKIVTDIIDMDIKSIIFSGGGEPLLYPYIDKVIKRLHNNNIDTALITNGFKLEGDIAKLLAKSKWIRISIDSCSSKLYSKIRGIPINAFDKVCNNIRNFLKIKEEYCELGVNYVINHMNYNYIYEDAKFIKDLGFNNLKFYPRVTSITTGYHKKFAKQVISDLKRIKQDLGTDIFGVTDLYEEGLLDCSKSVRKYDKCPIMQIIPVIAADSKLYICHDKAYTTEGIIGDLKKESLKEIWFSEKTKYIFDTFDINKYCKYHCAYDQRNIILNEYFNLSKNNYNFI